MDNSYVVLVTRGVYELKRSIRARGSAHLINKLKLGLKFQACLVNEPSLSTHESSRIRLIKIREKAREQA